jgi:hypothetical protein
MVDLTFGFLAVACFGFKEASDLSGVVFVVDLGFGLDLGFPPFLVLGVFLCFFTLVTCFGVETGVVVLSLRFPPLLEVTLIVRAILLNKIMKIWI